MCTVEKKLQVLNADFPAKNFAGCVVRVMVPLKLPKLLDYAYKSPVCAKIGQLVDIPVGPRRYHGVVTELPQVESSHNTMVLKEALPLDNLPPVADVTLKFWRWVSRYTLCAPGEALRAVLMRGQIPPLPAPEKRLHYVGQGNAKLTPQRQKVLELAQTQTFWQAGQLAEAAGVSAAVVQGLVKAEALAWHTLPAAVITHSYSPEATAATLNAEQADAAAQVVASLQRQEFEPFLLDGVMGSGKTEVYFEIIAHMLQHQPQKQALILLPEIALTPQWTQRFKSRFGFEPVLWHSEIAEGQRRAQWHAVHNGTAKVVVGARSALFLPFRDLGFVVVDEEHDGSYKQEDQFRYNGRDMAVVAASLWQCPVVLASATPSLETWYNVQQGRYKYLHLSSRYGKAVLPHLELVDLRDNPPPKGQWLSPKLVEALRTRLARGEQSLLFLNRRGYAPLLLCRGCGHRFDCSRCDASLTLHGNRLVCHHCGFQEHVPETCPKCSSDKLVPVGPGTRRIAQEVAKLLPQARIGLADSDAVEGVQHMAELVQQVSEGAIDIIIGTQMVAKGHNFPNLTLVGVVDADMGLALGDLRASERTFQLLTQVSGRAGRAEKKGEVLLQTMQSEHPLLQAILDRNRDGFYRMEMESRKWFMFPPFGRLVALLLSGTDEQAVLACGRMLLQNVPEALKGPNHQILGPTPAPLLRVKDKFRYRILVKGKTPLQDGVKQWIESTALPSTVRVDIDVDPLRFS